MAGIEKSASILIRKPLAEVFNFVTDPGNFHLWQAFVVDAALTSKRPMAAGATYRYTFQALGHKIETTGVITEYRPLHLYAYASVSGPFPIKGGFRFEEADGFVKVTAFGEAEPAGYFSMAGTLIGIILNRQLNVTLQTLKEVLENRG